MDKKEKDLRSFPPDAVTYFCKENMLHLSVGYPETLRYFIGKGVDIEGKNIAGETPLHTAARCGICESVRLLISASARMDTKDARGLRPIEVSANVETLKTFLGCGDSIHPIAAGVPHYISFYSDYLLAGEYARRGVDFFAFDLQEEEKLFFSCVHYRKPLSQILPRDLVLALDPFMK